MFSKFFGEYALALIAWALVCIATTVDSIGQILHSPGTQICGTLIYIPGVALGFVSIGKGIREMNR